MVTVKRVTLQWAATHPIYLGYCQENNVRVIEIDVSPIEEEYPGCVYEVFVQRPGEKTGYTADTTAENGIITWTLTSFDTYIAGDGKIMVRAKQGHAIKKTAIMTTITGEALDAQINSSAPSESVPGWLDQALSAAGDARDSAKAAQTEADKATVSATGAKEDADRAEAAANIATGAAAEAVGAKTSVEAIGAEAKTAAENAGTSANDAKETLALVERKLADGELKGEDGVSPTVEVSKVGNTATIAITDKDGKHTIELEDGHPGLNAPQIDDTNVSATNPWSSQRIIDTLCQEVAVSGNPVTCTPVEGSLLDIVASWEPTQGGNKEPYPAGGGKNLLDISSVIPDSKDTGFSVEGDAITYTFSESYSSDYFSFSIWVDVEPNTTYTLSGQVSFIGSIYLYTDRLFGNRINNYSISASNPATFSSGDNTRILIGFYSVGSKRTGTSETVRNLQLEKGTAATTYVPYANVLPISGRNNVAVTVNGASHTLILPGTIYGGDVTFSTGAGHETWKLITLDGATIKFTASADGKYWNLPALSAPNVFVFSAPDSAGKLVCSHFYKKLSGNATGFLFTKPEYMAGLFDTIDALNAYLVAQTTAGTPVQAAYKVSTPVEIQAAGAAGEIKAVAGTNTISTDADRMTVTCREAVRAGVKDVQVAGTSVLVDGVAQVPVANSSTSGVIRPDNFAVGVTERGILYVRNSRNGDLTNRSTNAAMTAYNLDYAVKAAMCDGKGAEWTAVEQAAARGRMGIDKPWELIEEITLTDATSVVRANEPDGTPYRLRKLFILFISPGTNTDTVVNQNVYVDNENIYNYGVKAIGANAGAESILYAEVANKLLRIEQVFVKSKSGSAYAANTPRTAYRAVAGDAITQVNLSTMPSGTIIKIYGVMA